MKTEASGKIKKLLLIIIEPIIYILAWILFLALAEFVLPKEIVNGDNFIILYSLVFLFALITKSTVWSIGHEKFGIKGDSRARLINYHWGEYQWFDLFGDNEELLGKDDMKKFILTLVDKKKVRQELK